MAHGAGVQQSTRGGAALGAIVHRALVAEDTEIGQLGITGRLDLDAVGAPKSPDRGTTHPGVLHPGFREAREGTRGLLGAGDDGASADT